MKDRFWLRFDGGERGGERVPIPSGGLSVGRGSDNLLVLGDASVSSRHAELAVVGDAVEVRDLGSTNGTRVGASRVETRRLAHGDRVKLGSVAFTFLDEAVGGGAQSAPRRAAAASQAAGESEPDEPVLEEPEIELDAPGRPEPRPARTARPRPPAERETVAASASDAHAERAGEGVGSVSAERLAHAGKRSWLASGVLLLLAAGTAAALWWRGGGGGGRERGVRAARVVEGNLIGNDSSFEVEGNGGWTDDEAAPAAFWRDRQFRHAGAQGLGVDLAAEEWAEARSPALRLPPGAGRDGLALSAQVRAAGDAELRLGLELRGAAEGALPVRVWADPVRASEGFVEVALATSVPPGSDRARVLVAAHAGAAGGVRGEGAADEGGGDAAVDDVVLLPGAGGGRVHELQEYGLHLLGEPPRTAALTRIDRVLLAGLELRDAEGAALPLAVTPGAHGRALAVDGAVPGPGVALRALVDGELARAGVGTLGAGGFRPHPLELEAEDVTDVLLGAGFDLVRLRFDAPVRVTGTAEEGALRLVARGDALAGAELQLSFREERTEATRLAREARDAERAGKLGACLATWAELLRRTPFDEALVAEAGEARARLTQEGSDRVQALAAELERARFFDLPDLFRRLADDARALEAVYAESEVGASARELEVAIETELAELDRDERGREASRLASVLAVLEERGAAQLAERVRGELESRYGGVPAPPEGAPVDGPDAGSGAGPDTGPDNGPGAGSADGGGR